MGKHVRRFLYLPPGAKPRYRFVVAISTIVLIAFGAMAAVAALYPENGPANAGPTDPAPSSEDGAPLPGTQGDSLPAGLTADYAVPSSWTWDTGFQAQVTMTNSSTAPQTWQLRLVYPPGVTGFVSSWVDGAPQPNNRIVGREFTFTGTQAVPPGQTTVLRLEFTRAPAANITVGECTINGLTCRQG